MILSRHSDIVKHYVKNFGVKFYREFNLQYFIESRGLRYIGTMTFTPELGHCIRGIPLTVFPSYSPGCRLDKLGLDIKTKLS